MPHSRKSLLSLLGLSRSTGPTSEPPFATCSNGNASGLLRNYFRSGWAFLTPYLAAYLLYAWLDWPVNPLSSDPEPAASVLLPPSLLHVYWVLHAIHLVLGLAALASLRGGRCETKDQSARVKEDGQARQDFPNLPPPGSGVRLLTTRYSILATLPISAPWLLLGLLIYIPGIYLEWPSDPWEHLRRINEWQVHDTVAAHSAWKKSSYFLPYSLTGHTTGLKQLSWLNFYYTGVCLLLCWQYYLLSRAIGLGERASFIFVLIQALMMGNNIFSFYRYYGLSSSIFAQLGAVALTRIALEAPSTRRKEPADRSSGTDGHARSSTGLLFPDSRLLHQVILALILLPLITFNHPQGIGIAALGILAVITWRLIEWKRVMSLWLAGAAGLASAAVILWLPRHPAIDEVYRAEGWLAGWYGFNLLSPASPTFESSLHTLGTFGVLNLGIGFWLIVRRNHLVGWITIAPVLALLLPCFALPLADRLITQSNIITFQRFFFAAPPGLALVVILSSMQDANVHAAWRASMRKIHPNIARFQFRLPTSAAWRVSCAAILPTVLFLTLTLSPGRTGYNRFWQSIQITPDDLRLKHLITIWGSNHTGLAAKDSTATVVTPLAGRIREVFSANTQPNIFRRINGPSATTELDAILNHNHSAPFFVLSNEFGQGQSRPDLLISSNPFGAQPPAQQIANLTTQRDSWMSIGGSDPESTASSRGSIVISNPSGDTTQAFTSALIAIDHRKRYQLACTIRQSGSPLATNYLAVAWYDKNEKHLVSSNPIPAGAGSPLGWANGTFSYYGLVNRPAPETWTRFEIVFGSAENAAIPVNAAFMRVGVLLNYNATPRAIVQLKDAVLWRKQSYTNLLLALPSTHNLYSPRSVSAQLSGHWGSQEVAKDHAGTAELRSVVFSGRK